MRAALYLRVSTQEQVIEGYSIPAQLNTLKSFCVTYKHTMYKIYQDAGISGKNIKDRPALLELLEDAKKKKFDCLIIWKLSRLSRSLLDLLSIVDTLNTYNVALISYSEHFDTSTPIGKMLLQMLGSIAEFERNTIIENVKLGLGERFKQGYSKGSIPFGYKHENKKAVIVPEQAELVKYAFVNYLEYTNKEGTTHIADYFNSNGFRTRTGGLWTRVTVRDMLRNIFYAGYVRTGIHSHGYIIKENHSEIQGMHEAIISFELYNKVKDKLNYNKQAVIRNPENDSLFTGLVTCPKCGNKLYALNTYNKYKNVNGGINKNAIRIYRCIGKDKQKCNGFYVSGNKIEKIALDLLFKITDKKFLNTLIKESIAESSKKKKLVDRIQIIDKELNSLNLTLNKYQKLFEASPEIQFAQFANKFNEIFAKTEALEKEKREELNKRNEYMPATEISKEIDKLKNFKEIFDISTNIERKEFIRLWVKSVNISVDKKVLSIELYNGIIVPNLLS